MSVLWQAELPYITVRKEIIERGYHSVKCEHCGKDFTYVRRYSRGTPLSAPKGPLNRADLTVIELIWHAYEFAPLSVFFDKRDV